MDKFREQSLASALSSWSSDAKTGGRRCQLMALSGHRLVRCTSAFDPKRTWRQFGL